MEQVCPHALWLNYVNPMAMIMWTIGKVLPGIRNVGLCHSVQGTAERLAKFVGVDHTELSYQVAGINHQAWFLDLRHHTYRGRISTRACVRRCTIRCGTNRIASASR